jgi:predicted O-methyltransferase YrrM
MDKEEIRCPAALAAIERETVAMGFPMASDRLTGTLLRALAASKPGGALLELGTGTGFGTAWLLDGVDAHARLTTVDNNPAVVAVAQRNLGHDPRVTFHIEDGAAFLEAQRGRAYDLIFADTWPGKFDHLEEALQLLKPGGLYIIDDLLPQPNWPEGHAPRVPALVATLEARRDLVLTKLNWSTGLIVATRRG